MINRFLAPIKVFVVSPFYIISVCWDLLAIERYNALVNPMKIHRRLTKRTMKIVIALTWILAIVFARRFLCGN